MASVDTLHAASKAFLDPSSARREQELQAGRLKLEQFKQKRKGKKANTHSNAPAEPRLSQDEETIQQADEQPTICLDSDLHGLGSQNGFRVLKGGTAKADPSIFQGRAQGLKQVGQTFLTWDSKVGTGDFENLVSIGSEPESVSVPFSRSDGIQVGVEDLQKFSQRSSNDHVDVEGAMFVDVNGSKMSTPLFSGQHSRLDNGVDDTSWSSNPSLTKLTSGQVLGIPEPDLLPPPSGITPDIKKLTLGDGIASFPLSNWSSLTFSRPFIIPPSTVSANGAYLGSRYGHGSVLQMSVSRPESSASPFLPQAEFPSLADLEINGEVSSVSSPVESLHTAPPKSLPLAGMSSSSFSFTSPLKPLSFKLLDTDPSQTAATTVPQMESIRSLSPTGLRSKPVPDYSFASVFDSPSFLTSLPSSKPSSEASRPTLFSSKTLPLSKSPLPSFSSSNDVSLRPVHLSFLQPVPSEPTIVSTSDFEERLVGIGQGREGEIMELPHLPLISFLNKGTENYGKTEQEDFLSLEQHIEDLTQERFSLQRSLDKESAVAESLVLENTVLVEDFNNQVWIL
jgi:hypothetical protein